MPDVSNAELVAMMQAMMARLDSIEARLDNHAPTTTADARLVRAVDGAVARAAANGLDVDARAQAAVGMLEVLTRPDMVGIVELIGCNADVFTALLRTLAQSPGTLDLITQTVASFLAQRDEHGRTLEQQLTELMGLAKRLTNPVIIGHIKAALDVFEESPDLYALGVDYLQQMVKQIVDLEGDIPTRIEHGVKLLEAATRPELVAMANDALALASRHPETARQLMGVANGMLDRVAASDLDLEQLAGQAWDLLELAATPENISLARDGLALVAKLNGTTPVLMGLADELVTKVNDPGFGFEERARTGLALLEKLSEPDTLAAVQQLTDSGVMDPAVMQLMARVGKALRTSTAGEIRPVGMFGALGALRSQRLQLAMGFGLDFAEQLGEALEQPLAITDQGA
jgi:hypothetical protein